MAAALCCVVLLLFHRIWYFALFDGHGGVRCATFASQRLHSAVIQAGLLTPKVCVPVCVCVIDLEM